MKRLLLASCIALLVLTPVLAFAQARTPPAGATSSGSAAPRGGDSSGGTSGGGSVGSGPGGSGGGGNAATAGAGGGAAIGRGDSYAGSRSYGTGPGGYGAPSAIDRSNGPRSGETAYNTRGGSASRAESRTNASVGQPVPAQTRPRGDGPTVGTAVPRGSVPKPPDGGGGGGGYYPPDWWPGYGGYWYPYSYGYGYGNYWGSCYWSSWYCGMPPYSYYQWFSPWSMWDDWSQMGYAYGGGVYERADLGGIRFKVKPKEAEIWADGYFEGQVNDYDSGKGLQLKGGMHHIEIKAKGYETITLDLRAMPGKTVTYTGELKAVPK